MLVSGEEDGEKAVKVQASQGRWGTVEGQHVRPLAESMAEGAEYAGEWGSRIKTFGFGVFAFGSSSLKDDRR